ncbi:MAG: cupin domain-containing protein [Alphaproteobacteria bacterium]
MAQAALNYTYNIIPTPSAPYSAGERDERPWGCYAVINAGTRQNQGFCEKRIVIHPGKALSLQRHQGRREDLYVLEGEVHVIINATLHRKSAGGHVEVPLHAIHSLVNLGERPVLIYERQHGFCRENDNERLWDINGRPATGAALDDAIAHESIRLYKNITALLQA